MKRILFTVISLIIITFSFMVVPVFAEKATNTFVNTKVNTDMYYFNAKKTVVNDRGIAVSIR